MPDSQHIRFSVEPGADFGRGSSGSIGGEAEKLFNIGWSQSRHRVIMVGELARPRGRHGQRPERRGTLGSWPRTRLRWKWMPRPLRM